MYCLKNGVVQDFYIHSMDIVDDVTNRKLRYVTSLLRHRQPDVPVLIVDLKVVEEVHKRWKKLMPRVEPFYAIKANSDPKIISELVKVGARFDCASLREVNLVLQEGGHPSNIIFAQPSKIPSFITQAASKGVNLMVFDTECEVEKLKRLHPNCKAVLRLSVCNSYSLVELSSKYGALKDEVPGLLKKALDANIEVVGVAFHVGSLCGDPKAFRLALEEVQEVFEMAATSLQMSLTLVDIGGGFPGAAEDGRATIEEFSIEINREVERLFPHSDIKIISEPGVYFSMRTTAILLQVHTKRIRRRRKENQSSNTEIIHYYMNDGFYGNLSNLIIMCWGLRQCTFLTKSKLNVDMKFPSMVWGPTCDSIDAIGEDVMWPELEVGDYVFLDDVGAYGQSCATSFNGYGTEITETYYI